MPIFLPVRSSGLADFLLRHEAERKRIERTRDHHQIRALRDRIDRRDRIDLSEVHTVADQRLNLPGRAGRENQVGINPVLGQQPQVHGRPHRRLKTGETGISDVVALLRAPTSPAKEAAAKSARTNFPNIYFLSKASMTRPSFAGALFAVGFFDLGDPLLRVLLKIRGDGNDLRQRLQMQ